MGHRVRYAVVEITGVTEDVINGLYRLASLLAMTGFNHGQANSASTPGGMVLTTDTISYDGGMCLATLDKLRAAASAWSAAARSVSAAGEEVPGAVAGISMQTSPEVADATQVCTAMGIHLRELSTAYSSMSAACSDYARHLDDAHSQVIDELVSLLEWTAALELGGGLLAVVTVGISEAAANTALAVRCAVVAARVGEILARLIELAGEAAQAIARALARVIEISRKLKALLGRKLSQATATEVTRSTGLAKDAEELATDGLKAAAEKTTAKLGGGEVPTPHGIPGALEDLNPQQAANYERYVKKLPAKNEGVDVELLDNGGVRLSSKVPANNVPGSYAEYIKILDKEGETVQYVKDTYAPDGTIVHSKVKG
ncbi:MAG: hypothetical protein ACRDRU_12460 [Pseudonocardiaceae bacterium]